MFKGDNRQLEAFKVLPVMAISSGARVYKPTAEQISRMMESLDRDGQQTPIVVHSTGRRTGQHNYEIVSGATRFEAAVKLGWVYIQAKIMQAEHHLDFKIAELVENEFRSDMTEAQHAEMQAKLKQLRADRKKDIAEALAEIEDQPKAKGGRGKKGGVADVARRTGVPETTVRRKRNLAKRSRGEVSVHVTRSSDDGPEQEPVRVQSLVGPAGGERVYRPDQTPPTEPEHQRERDIADALIELARLLDSYDIRVVGALMRDRPEWSVACAQRVSRCLDQLDFNRDVGALH